ncbi:crotonase/enoyl-CoA hydratase family protein [Williamsia sterculiae]|uniref:Enoyl-CoA hydratase n=1 Tax=Williamsia sterculiae TaxID=1344003 RepID=A0A1N7FGV7_9NOCA|nr:crotonase/enoyl-CoA hydratase family protein [Williamsia sterculiae]SIR99533.1 enoyl-CoA hydratase [Williamsia sterculiae]
MSQWTAFEVTVADHVAEVTLIGPGKGNAMGPDFWRELPEVFAELDADTEVRAVVLAGRGKHFSFGLDLSAMAGELGPVLAGDALAKTRTEFHRMVLRMQGATTAVARSRTPVVAVIQGWCIGGGVDLIAAADIRYASADATFSVREAKVGMVADMGSLQRLPAIIGDAHTRELAFTAKDIDADAALRINLVNDVLPDADAALATARATAAQIAANPPLVVQGVKDVLDWPLTGTVDDGLRYVAAWNAAFLPSKDIGEAISAIFEKRPPSFTGE